MALKAKAKVRKDHSGSQSQGHVWGVEVSRGLIFFHLPHPQGS